LADFNNFWHATSRRNSLHVSEYSFAHLTLVLLLHYLVKCRSRSLLVYNNEFILCGRPSARIGANKRSKSMWFTIATCFEADAARVEFVVFQQDSAPSHRAKYTVALLDQETPDFIPPALWLPDLAHLNPVD